MKSKLRKAQVGYYLFIIILICGICGGFLYELGYKLPFLMKSILAIVILGYPILTLYSFLKIPEIEINEDRIIEKTIGNEKVILIKDIKEVLPLKYKNKVYKIGHFYTLISNSGLEINIPYKIYSNEKDMLEDIKCKIKL